MKRWIASGCGLFVMLAAVAAHARPAMTWYIISFEPAYITEGEKKGSGFVDIQLEMYRQSLPQYDHEISVANLSRIRKELQRTDKLIATPGQGGPPGRFGGHVLVSQPTVHMPPHRYRYTHIGSAAIRQWR